MQKGVGYADTLFYFREEKRVNYTFTPVIIFPSVSAQASSSD